MSLLESQMAERRARILEAARKLITSGGFDGLTMRQLAETARVSVPTVYNLIGNKYLLLDALMKEQMSKALGPMAAVPRDLGPFEYLDAMVTIAHDIILAEPAYHRALIRVFLTSEDSLPARRELDRQSIALMSLALDQGKRHEAVLAFIDLELAAGALYTIYMAGLLRWACHEIEDEELRLTTKLGMALVLLGITAGETRKNLERALQEQQHAVQKLIADRHAEED